MSAIAAALVVAAALLASTGLRRRTTRPLRTDPVPPDDSDCIAAFELAAAEIRSGTSVTASVQLALERHRGVLPAMRTALASGATFDTALGAALDGATNDFRAEERWFAHSLALCQATGGASSDVLERAVEVARERRAWASERHAQAAQARLSARLLTLLPIVFAVWSIAGSPSVRQVYRTSPVVVASSLAGLCLNLAGWWWMRRLVSTDGRA